MGKYNNNFNFYIKTDIFIEFRIEFYFINPIFKPLGQKTKISIFVLLCVNDTEMCKYHEKLNSEIKTDIFIEFRGQKYFRNPNLKSLT